MWTILVFLLGTTATSMGSVSFITVGDWGGAALEEPTKPYAKNVKDVASAMADAASKHDASFVINTGDNFYWCGIMNTSDHQVQKDWLETYSAPSLQVPWYGVLGNHEYGYNVSAQIELAKLYKNWVMDARYYSRRVALTPSQHVSFIFLDSSPCVSEYRSTDNTGWDPCGSEYPTCSMSGGHDDFEGTCHFHKNIMAQDCGPQLAWFKTQLAAVPKEDWLIVVAHHEASEIDVEDFATPLQQHGFDLYLNGHVHSLIQYQVDGKGAYVTSGAGALVMSHDQLGGTPAKDRTFNKLHELDLHGMSTMAFGSNQSAGKLGHTYDQVWASKTSGFTLHTFSEDMKTLTTDFIDSTGATVHSMTVKKGVAPTPAPAPPPGANTCKILGCKYNPGAACQCDKTCQKYHNCCNDFKTACK